MDLPAGLGGRVWERVCGVLAGGGALGGGEDQVAVREAGVLARRLVRAPVPAGEGGAGGGERRDGGGRWSGTVLVTGGDGGAGAA